MRNQHGNILFLILIAVVLFAALSYAVTQSTRGVGSADKELAEIAQAEEENCTLAVDTAKARLEIVKGCDETEISYELPDGSNSNPNAPTDKSCHVFAPGDGGAPPCGVWTTEEGCLATLTTVGQRCGSIVYAGMFNGARMYTTAADRGSSQWSVSHSQTNINHANDGMANTNDLLDLSASNYPAANSCRSLGEEWYLPAYNQVVHLNNNQTAIGGFVSSGLYWTSTENGAAANEHARVVSFQGDPIYYTTMIKHYTRRVRCVRND